MELKEKEGTEGVQTCNPTHLPLIWRNDWTIQIGRRSN
jgi:hypothetical protein